MEHSLALSACRRSTASLPPGALFQVPLLTPFAALAQGGFSGLNSPANSGLHTPLQASQTAMGPNPFAESEEPQTLFVASSPTMGHEVARGSLEGSRSVEASDGMDLHPLSRPRRSCRSASRCTCMQPFCTMVADCQLDFDAAALAWHPTLAPHPQRADGIHKQVLSWLRRQAPRCSTACLAWVLCTLCRQQQRLPSETEGGDCRQQQKYVCDETEGDDELLSEGAGRTAASALLPSNNRKEGGAGKRLSLEDLQVRCKGIRGCWHDASLTMCSSAGSLFMLHALSAPAPEKLLGTG